MTRVAVTGGSGKLGRAVVTELLEHGYDVFNVDIAPPSERLCPFTRIDLTDFGQVVEALSGIDQLHDGVDAVVHLAAIPGPTHAANTATFHNNLTSTYNVWTAARLAGIRNLVWASSETLLGYPFDAPPPYLPVDEEYPARPEVAYALAKFLEEQLAGQLCRWDPALKLVGLRFSNVMEPADYATFPDFEKDPAGRKWNLWSYIDSRDGAQAVRLALEHDQPGFDTFLIANPDTVMSRPTLDLVEEFFPDVPRTGSITGTGSLQNIDKAQRVLGFSPTHTWRGVTSLEAD